MSDENKRWFRRGKALSSIRDALEDAKQIRIATAFFELSGYDLLSDILTTRSSRLLIGNEDNTSGKIPAFLDSFIQSVNAMDDIETRVRLLQKFRQNLKSGRVSLGLTPGAKTGKIYPAFKAHHAKLYIADQAKCVVTSANFTRTGLKHSLEAGYLVENLEDVLYFCDRFDEVFAKAEPLTDSLIEIMDELLSLRSPYEVYARSLLELYGLPEDEKAGALPTLTDYQRPVVAGILQSIREHNGAMLVASTGLGKTVMASHIARILRNDSLINRVIIFCPAGLKDMWSRSMRAANVSSREFTFQIVSLNDWKKYRMVQILEEELRYIDDKTLIIVDESHHLRNERGKDKTYRKRNDRIFQAVHKGSRILLMTATPYSRDISDINSQLRILPRTRKSGIFKDTRHHWQIHSSSDLSQLEIASVLTAPSVVSYFSQTDPSGSRYVTYFDKEKKSEKRYFPKTIQLRARKFKNAANPVLKKLIESNLLRRAETGDAQNLFDEQPQGKRDGFFEARLVHQFCSSLHYARHTLKKIHDTGDSSEDDAGYEKMRFANSKELKHLTKDLQSQMKKITEDDKFNQLIEIIKENYSIKMVIFVIYRETAKDLANKLSKQFPDLVIEKTSEVEPDRLDSILERFAPIAAGLIHPSKEDEFSRKILREKIDILIATEAVSEGYNLQDAPILINYDLPWSVLHLAQRMGRILRPWHESRNIQIWNFFPDTMDSKIFPIAERWQRRLINRSSEQASFSHLPVIIASEKEDLSLYSYTEDLKDFFDRDVDLNETLSFIDNAERIHTSTVFDDLAKIGKDQLSAIKKLRTPFRAIKKSNEKGEGMYALFRLRSRFFTYVFKEDGSVIKGAREQMKALEMIKALPDESFESDFSISRYEYWLQKGIESFAKEIKEPPEEIQPVCSLAMIKP